METLIHGDCLEKLKEIPDNSIDSIVTDPPYGLSFMGKKWDYDVPSIEIWKECLRVLKPGGHLLSFAGSRTYHRMAVRIEDAGFEIRDQIMWVYGSGFPKSLDISKAIDKRRIGDKFVEMRQYLRDSWKTSGKTQSEVRVKMNDCGGGGRISHYFGDSQPLVPNWEDWLVLKSEFGMDSRYDDLIREYEREVTGIDKKAELKDHVFFGDLEKAKAKGNTIGYGSFERRDKPSHDLAKQWEGWGTALKPAHEPIVVARKPLIGTVAENVLTHGTGGINIDGCRVEAEPELAKNWDRKAKAGFGNGLLKGGLQTEGFKENTPTGRWPANLIHDGSEEVLEGFPNTKPSKIGKPRGTFKKGLFANSDFNKVGTEHNDSGSAARFFYCAKASKKDRDEGLEGFEEKEAGRGTSRRCGNCKKPIVGLSQTDNCSCDNRWEEHTKLKNSHPTVKPTALMRYLVKLVTPKGGTVLDPFTGSGSTGKACKLEGFNFIGVEREEEYVKIARARIEAVSYTPTLL